MIWKHIGESSLAGWGSIKAWYRRPLVCLGWLADGPERLERNVVDGAVHQPEGEALDFELEVHEGAYQTMMDQIGEGHQ